MVLSARRPIALHPPAPSFWADVRRPRSFQTMRLLADTQERIRILALAGEIDLHFAPVFRTLLEQPTQVPAEALVLDLAEVEFLDSSGIAVIIEHLRSAARRAKTFCIGGTSDAVKQIFEIIHLEKVMPVFETREAALEALQQNKIREPREPLFAPVD